MKSIRVTAPVVALAYVIGSVARRWLDNPQSALKEFVEVLAVLLKIAEVYTVVSSSSKTYEYSRLKQNK